MDCTGRIPPQSDDRLFDATASRYAVRNQPLAFDDACLEDEDYLPLLERALGHASATIRQLAQSILDEAMRHPDRLEKLPATMRERIRNLQQQVLVAQLRGMPSCPKPAAAFRNPFRHLRQ